MERSIEIDKLAFALVKAQAEFSAVPKDSNNPFFKSKYAALPDVVKHTAPVLAKHGLAVSQFISSFDTLTTYLLHESGQFIAHEMKLHLVPDKNDVITPQAQGAAVTYARRYSYMAALGVVADDDDDGNSASQSSPRNQSNARPTQQSLGNKVANASGGNMATEPMTKAIWAISHKGLNMSDFQMQEAIEKVTGHASPDLKNLTYDEAKAVIEYLKSLQDNN